MCAIGFHNAKAGPGSVIIDATFMPGIVGAVLMAAALSRLQANWTGGTERLFVIDSGRFLLYDSNIPHWVFIFSLNHTPMGIMAESTERITKEESSIMTTIQADHVLDCKGLACPMPIVRTKKTIDAMQPGEVVEMQATDPGSLADIRGWAKSTGHHYLGTIREGEVFKHFIRKGGEGKEEVSFMPETSNAELNERLGEGGQLFILDVREPAEYAFGHIPGSRSIPLDELESRLNELSPEHTYYVVCRTGRRSGLACALLKERGFKSTNVVPGMSEWNGQEEKKLARKGNDRS